MKNNANINGSGRMQGGIYDCVNINGSGHIDGDLSVQSMTINGSGSVQGDLHTDGTFTINGSGRVDGNITGDGHISIHGSGKVNGSVHCQVYRSAGSGSVQGDCEAEEITMEGGGRIENLLNGENIHLVLYPQCRMYIGSIGGTNITVEHKLSENLSNAPLRVLGIRLPFGSHSPVGQEEHRPCGKLETDTIEGDTITLSHTAASCVRGRIVKLGKGCQIARVEYTESYDTDPDAVVGEVVQV